jgi:hypothetical protein
MTEWLDNVAAADRLNIAPDTLNRWRMRKHGPSFFKVAGRVKYDPADIDAWIAAQRVDLDGQAAA